MRNLITKKCKLCLIEFTSYLTNHREYCSSKCAYQWRISSKQFQKRITVKCDQCGKFFEKWPSTVKPHNFCSKECGYVRQKGVPVYVPKISKKIECICKMCGKQFLRFPSAIHTIDVFCSHSCSSKHINKYIKGSRSKLEKYLEQKIKTCIQLPVLFNNREILNGYELDIYFPSKNLAFELNGPWHYIPINGEEHLLKVQSNDGNRKMLCEKYGINLHIFDVSKDGDFNQETGEKYYQKIINILS